MDPLGPPIASSVAGTSQAERLAARDANRPQLRAAARFRKLLDQDEVSITPVEASEALRDPKGNEQEESHEDRQEHGHYDPHGVEKRADDDPPRIDIQG